ncbi:MAG: hypothetical protein ACE5MG_12780, partial [Candidatus Methylomirabilales bacterium]
GDPTVLNMDPKQRRGEIFDALRRLTVRASEVRPQVVVYEDLHWMDEATQEYLLFSADSIPTSRVLRILTYRTGYAHPFGERTYHTRIALDTLSIEDSVQMAHAMLATERLPEELKALIVRKAEGNPFFVEEVIKALREVGVIRPAGDRYILAKRLDEIFVPDTIQDVIMARIDRLEEAPKKTLQLASVIGREFTRRLLDRLADIRGRTEEFLRELKAIELIYEKSLFPELTYMFKHALTHEVAYNSLLVGRRKELHHIIGSATEELYADRLAELYEVLAHHFSKAEQWVKALDYLLRAAEKAGQTFAIREALTLYDQALEAARHIGDDVPATTLMAIHQAKSNHYFAVGEYEHSRTEGELLLAQARQSGDRISEAAALGWTSFATMWAHDFDAALVYAGEAIEIAKTVGAQSAMAGGYLTIGSIHGVTARLDEAREEARQAVTISHTAGDLVRQCFSLVFAALLENWRGAYRDAASLTAEGIRIAREHNLLTPLLRNLWAHAVILTGKGDYDEALALLEEGLPLALKVDDIVYIARYLNTLAWLHGECENLDRALELGAQAAVRARSWRHPVGVEQTAYTEICRGNYFMAKGDFAQARELFDEMHGIVRNPKTHPWLKWRYSILLFVSLGEFWLSRGEPAKARQFADQSLEIATPTDSRKYLARGWRLKGEIALTRRQWDEAESALRQALAIAEAIGNPPQLWKTHAALGRFYSERSKPEAARNAYEAARGVIERIAVNLSDPRLRASLESAPLIRQVYELSPPD